VDGCKKVNKDLSFLANQGVLLLPVGLTGSLKNNTTHHMELWNNFISHALDYLSKENKSTVHPTTEESASETPEELLEKAYQSIRSELAGQLARCAFVYDGITGTPCYRSLFGLCIKFRIVGVIDNSFKHCYIRYMKAQLMIKTRRILSENAFVEAVIWKVPQPVIGSTHNFKYRLSFVIDGISQLRYDNEDHKHAGAVETFYSFTSPEQLLSDFWYDVDNWEA
jgi:hypothetical protein